MISCFFFDFSGWELIFFACFFFFSMQLPLAFFIFWKTVFVVSDIFANQDKIRRIQAPVFIVHGTEDEVISVSHGRVCACACKHTSQSFHSTLPHSSTTSLTFAFLFLMFAHVCQCSPPSPSPSFILVFSFVFLPGTSSADSKQQVLLPTVVHRGRRSQQHRIQVCTGNYWTCLLPLHVVCCCSCRCCLLLFVVIVFYCHCCWCTVAYFFELLFFIFVLVIVASSQILFQISCYNFFFHF